MTISVPALTTLDPTAVDQNLQQAAGLLQELAPELDLSGSVLEDLVIYYSAVLETATQTEIEQLQATFSLLLLNANPSLADATTLDAFFSHYLLTPQAGAASQGAITIIVSANTTVTISQGALFDAGGQQFASDEAYVAKSEASQINNATDILLASLQDGTFAFSISVTAVTSGAPGNVTLNTPFVPETQPANFLRAYASSDFTGGLNPQTVQALIGLLQEGIAAKALSDRVNMTAALHNTDAFPNALDSSIIGLGDPEMLRDAHTIWPMHFGGRIDWYVRTQSNVQQLVLQPTATLVKINADGSGLWQFPITKTDAPGYYEIRSILLPTDSNVAGSFPIVSEIRSIDATGGGFVPDMVSALECAFSSYQAATVQFTDNVTPLTNLEVGATAPYNVVVALMPQIDAIQATFGDRQRRNAAGDVLVKAPVPCFVELSFTISQVSGEAPPDVKAIATALAARVAQVGFAGSLSASYLQPTIYSFLSSTMTVSSIQMLGRIVRPDGQDQTIFDTEKLEIPDLPAAMTTANTTLFFLDPSDVAIAINTEVLPAV